MEKALELEKELKKQRNIKELLNVSLDFWYKFGAGQTFVHRFPKICYYMGRLNDFDGLKTFMQKNKVELSMWVDTDTKMLGQKLLSIGAVYPNLNNQDYIILEELYSNPKHFDLIEDILFDQDTLLRPLKKFVASVRITRHSVFSDELKREVFNGFIYNSINNPDYNTKEEVCYYERTTNKIINKVFNEDVIQDVHFYINFFPSFKMEHFANHVKLVYGENFFNFYSQNIVNDKKFTYEHAKRLSIDAYAFEVFQNRLSEYTSKEKLPTNGIDEVIKNMANDWLLIINSRK